MVNCDNDNDHFLEEEELDIQFEEDAASEATDSPPPCGQRRMIAGAAAQDLSTDEDSEHEGPQLSAKLPKKDLMGLMTETKTGVSALTARLDKLRVELRKQQSTDLERHNEMLNRHLTTQQQQQQQCQAILMQQDEIICGQLRQICDQGVSRCRAW